MTQADQSQTIVEQALATVDEMSPQQTDGMWLERLTVQVAPFLKEWDVDECWAWEDWPDRQEHYPASTRVDVGVDAVAVRHDDSQFIAIQCKSRQLDAMGHGSSIAKVETDKIRATSSDPVWAERWLVTNGDVSLSENIARSLGKNEKPLKLVNIADDLRQQLDAAPTEEDCPHCAPHADDETPRQTKSCMQREAVAESVRLLREHEQSKSGGTPLGRARGKIILPCGTGKTRISLRIVEELTAPGALSIVLCPSIALVAQIRREYLQHANARIRALAVCSDETAGYDPRKEGTRNTADDPTLDNGNVGVDVVKGKVTTDAAEIAQWIRDGQRGGRISVIFGTYQSGARVAEALQQTGVTASVLVCDEAHRTAGLRRKKNAQAKSLSPAEQRIRDFALCHNDDAFPATYRVYQTATPRIYKNQREINQRIAESDWFVRSMDDEKVFGVDLYSKTYVEAVNNGWLSDYRIIAVGVQDHDAYDVANRLAGVYEDKGRNRLTTSHFLRGLAFALAMGGATKTEGGATVPIKSCIAFMNTVDKSKNMANDLQQPIVRDWMQQWLENNDGAGQAADYSLEHLDATSNVARRENGKRRLAGATDAQPHGIINVGIFGEGVDSPSLSAVAFLEPRKSPVDVIQAVGRAMRTAPDKSMGYIICPIVFPANADAEQHLSTSGPEDGWQELGQILLALRAHDKRIADSLADMLYVHIPRIPERVHTFIGIARGPSRRIQYYIHEGAPGDAQDDVESVLKGAKPKENRFRPVPASYAEPLDTALAKKPGIAEAPADYSPGPPPTVIITGKVNADGSPELRQGAVERDKPKGDEFLGQVNNEKTQAKAKDMINKGTGTLLPPKPVKTPEQIAEEERKKREREVERQGRLLADMKDFGDAIRMNLLEKSGLTADRVTRDLNLLRDGVDEAAHHLRHDELGPALDRHFLLDQLREDDLKKQADGCTIAALLMMNAAMLHQRIANGRWLTGISDLAALKSDTAVVRRITREWNRIRDHDFLPVFKPAVDAIEAIEDTRKLAGLERALHHIAAEAERIAETYADMGVDYAGELFNKVMGNQASDGAYFTRPVAASLAARLTLDACGDDVDWRDKAVWLDHKTVDLACGSGTLLAAMMTDMKRRAKERGASPQELAELQKVGVEDVFKGLDINDVSLQLAAAQLTAGNHNVSYRRMGLHKMPYGPRLDDPNRVDAGTLELLGQSSIVSRQGQMDIADEAVASQAVRLRDNDDAELEDAVAAARGARIVIMNPPFTNRKKMGEKFPLEVKKKLQKRVDALEENILRADPNLMEFANKNSIGPLFVALADQALKQWPDEIMTMINPTIAMCSSSGYKERQVLAERFHIHTVVTCHQPKNVNMSQSVGIHESIVVMQRQPVPPPPPTRFIHLDKLPADEQEVADLHISIVNCPSGQMNNGWGVISYWPAERIAACDWSPSIWRSAVLAEAAYQYSIHPQLLPISESFVPRTTLEELYRDFERADQSVAGSIPILATKSSDGQVTIQGAPDEFWIPKERSEDKRVANGGTFPQVDKLSAKASHLLITHGQNSATARLSAVAAETPYVGTGWLPIVGVTLEQAKALAVFLNSTPGRVQIMRNPGTTLAFPLYNPTDVGVVRVPDVKNDARIRDILAACWERTRDMEAPQYRDGECEVRQLWDEAVAEAMGWDATELAHLRQLLHDEPHVRGLGYGQYGDEADEYADEDDGDEEGDDSEA